MLTKMIGVSLNSLKPCERKHSLSSIAAFESAPNVPSALKRPKKHGQIFGHTFGQNNTYTDAASWRG
jgi:hypothetical protein